MSVGAYLCAAGVPWKWRKGMARTGHRNTRRSHSEIQAGFATADLDAGWERAVSA